jgi:alpha-1,2-mannosyltransferase
VTRQRLTGLIALLAGVVAVNLLLWRMGHTTSLRYVRMLLIQQASADSWRPMTRGLEAWDSGLPIYDTVFFRDRVKFQYPPSSLLLPLALRSEQRSGIPLFHALNRVGLVATLVVWVSTVVLFARTWQTGSSPTGRWRLWLGGVVVAAASVAYFPVTISYVLGQIQTIVNAAISVALVCWLVNHPTAAGLAVGIASLVKPHFALLLVWGAVRRRWSFVVAATVTASLGAAMAVAIFGWSEHVAYVRVLSYIGERGEALYANQTFNGLLNRLLQPPEHRGWDFHSYPPPLPIVTAGTAATSAALLALAIWLPRRLLFAGTTLDLAIACLSVTMASPIAWDHHYGILLPILVLAGGVASSAGAPRWVLPALVLAAVATGNLWEPLIDVEAPPWNVVQSYVLAGALLALMTLYRLGTASGAVRNAVGE